MKTLFLVYKANFHAKNLDIKCDTSSFIYCLHKSQQNLLMAFFQEDIRWTWPARACALIHLNAVVNEWVRERVRENKLRANSKINQIVSYLSPSFHLSDERYCQSIGPYFYFYRKHIQCDERRRKKDPLSDFFFAKEWHEFTVEKYLNYEMRLFNPQLTRSNI